MNLPSEFPFTGGIEELEALLGVFIARQDWAQVELGSLGGRSIETHLIDIEVLSAGRPGLASIVTEAGGKETSRLHVVVGWRPLNDPVAAPLRPGAVIGTGEDAAGEVVFYDAFSDPTLCLELLSVATGGRESASRARLVQSLVSHSALIFDERLFMKCYRVIEPRPRPEIEMMTALDKMGFNHLLAPLGHWSRPSGDLGLVREFLPGAVEGKALAHTSLRDLLARADTRQDAPSFGKVGLAGGDLGDETRRLGTTTAEMHLALADAFGLEERDGLPAIRLHGDYHLRRVMRFEAGWLVAGFGDDPLMSEAGAASQGEAKRGSVLVDIADLFVSFGQVAAEAVELQPPSTLAHSRRLASGWVLHNAGTFLDGYLAAPGVERVLPLGREAVVRRLVEGVRPRLAGLGLSYGA